MSLRRRDRRSERLALVVSMAAVALAVFVTLHAVAAGPDANAPVQVQSTPVPLDPSDASRSKVGALRFLGGLWLRSDDARFGGLSDLRVSREGSHLTAVTDCGSGFTARLSYDVEGRLVGLGDPRLAALQDAVGQPLTRDEIDAESLMFVSGDELDVGFEGRGAIRAYGPDFSGPARPLPTPEGLRDCGGNGGLELIADAGEGRRLLVCETRRSASQTVPAWIGSADGWQPREYPLTFDGGWGGEPFRPTGAARLSNGDMLVLERRFPPLAARLVRVTRETLEGTGLLAGTEIARLEAPLSIDNFEGVEVLRDTRGRTVVYLLSDDNNCTKGAGVRSLSPQRTLLLQFALEE
jgi:hypothetical protein